MKPWLPVALLLMAVPLAAQQAAGRKPAVPLAKASETNQEQQDLERVLAAAGANPAEYLRAIEKHLARFPDTTRRAELEGAAAHAAMEAGDGPDIVEYGERVLVRRPDDLQLLDAVSDALLAAGSPDAWQRALRYSHRSEDLLLQRLNQAASRGREPAELLDQIDRELAKALRNEARATGNLGRVAEALALARRSFETFPNAESAREAARWCERLGRPLEAARALADAVTVVDARATLNDRARDRARMDELYRQATRSGSGEGDLVLEAFDRNVALVHAREARSRSGDPNALLGDPMEFTITSLDGDKFRMASLKGKVVVLDFWATWCLPCREQHPLLEQVRKRFAGNPDVAFLSIATDEEREPVKAFVQEAHWDDSVYFEDGLSRNLSVWSLPTTIVFGRDGKLFSRLTGFAAGQFAGTLTERIADAVGKGR